MHSGARHRELELAEVAIKAWSALPGVKILQAFEIRRDCAQEAIETGGWCPAEGKEGERRRQARPRGCDVLTASCSPRYLSFLVLGSPQKRVRVDGK